jgi:uroporphyrin-3 C-methyltransferase
VSDQSDDKEKKDAPIEDSPAEASAGDAASWNPAAEPPRKPAAKPVKKPVKGKGSSLIAWLALLLVIGLCVAAAWSVQEAQRRETAMIARLKALESVEGSQQGELESLSKELQGQIRAGLARVETAGEGLAEVQSAAAGQAMQLERLEAALVVQREEITRFGATDRQDWLLAEAEYLLRLANQRLIMAGDVVAAAALLGSADAILLEMDDVSLHSARAAVAADLAALRAVPTIDVQGLYLRLAALIGQVDKLAIFQLPDAIAPVEQAPAEGWQVRLQRGYQEALRKLSDYIVIRRREVPYQALMDPQWEGLVRQNMRMLLEQAQVALLSGNQVLFRESLDRAGHWVQQFFEVDQAGSTALASDMAELTQQTIAVDIPDVARSLRALDEAMERRLLLEDGN